MPTTKSVQPYLFFEGKCEEAIEFYKQHIGAEVVMLMRYSDSPEPAHPGMPPGSERKVMHSTLKIGDSIVMASDGMCGSSPTFEGFSLSLVMPNEAEAQRVFAAFSEGGQVNMPLGKTFWSPLFGMVKDRFGIHWMVTLPQVSP